MSLMSRRMIEVTPELMLRAYRVGLFPMAETRHGSRLYWLDPELRGVLPLDEFHLPRRLLRTVLSDRYEVSSNRAFPAVVAGCAAAAPGRQDTWINADIERLFGALHRMGHAHSVECRRDGVLVGGDERVSGEVEDVKISPSVSLIWEPASDRMGYLTFARSYRPQGTDIASAVNAFETEVPASDRDFEPERSDLIELGGKMDLMDGRVGLTAAVFQHEVASQTASCAMGLADKIVTALDLEDLWPAVFMITANCAEAAAYRFIGLPYEVWSGLLFAAMAAIASSRRSRRALTVSTAS